MIASLLSIKISVHIIDNSKNESRGGGVQRDAGGDEKQLIKFVWPISLHFNPFITEWLIYCQKTHATGTLYKWTHNSFILRAMKLK